MEPRERDYSMPRVFKSVDELIGRTPLMQLSRIENECGINAHIFAKIERFNPAGSAKDRVAKFILDDAEASGELAPGGTVIEPTSGNTGIGIAMLCAVRGYKAIIVMPDTMSKERQLLIKAYGAELVLTEGAKGMAGAIAKADEIHANTPGSIIAGQFVNPSNAKAHYLTTGPEIWIEAEGKVDAFVAGIGTGGTISGTGKYLKQQNREMHIVGVEPAGSPFLSKGETGKHDLQGIGAGFAPEVLDQDIYDEIMAITDEEAYKMGRMLAAKEGILCGITSGAALAAAVKLASRKEFEFRNIVVLLPDTGERYLSTKMFEE